jgi:hypothetical protein
VSESYEAVVFSATETATRSVWTTHSFPWPVALMYLSPGHWGLCRVASRAEAFDPIGLELVAAQVSRDVGAAVALSYDNSTSLRTAAVFRAGALDARVGQADEVWVPLDSGGRPTHDGPRLSSGELDPGREYECVTSAIDIGLGTIGMDGITPELLKQAFCYGEARTVAW